MTQNTQLEKQTRKLIRQQLVHERRLERKLDKDAKNFRTHMAKTYKGVRKAKRPITVLAEGDSWFSYPVGKSITFHLRNHPKMETLNLASHGDEMTDMLSDKQRKRLVKELRRGPQPRRKYDAFVFSGGGNDLLGNDRFRLWIKDYKKGMTPKQIINKSTLKTMLDYIECRYQEVIDIRDEYSKNTIMYLNAYDFAQPNGEGVCGRGPWLLPALKYRKVPKKHHEQVVVELLKIFHKRLEKISDYSRGIVVLPTQGTLNKSRWHNEIHPTNKGFKQVAKKFISAIETDFARE